MLAYDMKNNQLPLSFTNFFTQINTDRQTRQYNHLYIQRPRTSFSARSVAHQIVKIWNELPNEIKCIPTRSCFNYKLKMSFTDKYSNLVICHNPHCRQCSNNQRT